MHINYMEYKPLLTFVHSNSANGCLTLANKTSVTSIIPRGFMSWFLDSLSNIFADLPIKNV